MLKVAQAHAHQFMLFEFLRENEGESHPYCNSALILALFHLNQFWDANPSSSVAELAKAFIHRLPADDGFLWRLTYHVRPFPRVSAPRVVVIVHPSWQVDRS